MLKQMNWHDVYALWRSGSYHFPELLTTPVSPETIFVAYSQDGYIYGYDWLEASEAQARKQMIEKNPTQFLHFTKSTNKGTIQTAGMLAEAQRKLFALPEHIVPHSILALGVPAVQQPPRTDDRYLPDRVHFERW